jgi:hypothetical protein
MKNVATALCVAMMVASCAGRQPNPVPVASPFDAQANCAGMSSEMTANASKLTALEREAAKARGGNVGAVVGAVIFPPMLLFLNLKGAARAEAEAIKARNEYLASMKMSKGCTV